MSNPAALSRGDARSGVRRAMISLPWISLLDVDRSSLTSFDALGKLWCHDFTDNEFLSFTMLENSSCPEADTIASESGSGGTHQHRSTVQSCSSIYQRPVTESSPSKLFLRASLFYKVITRVFFGIRASGSRGCPGQVPPDSARRTASGVLNRRLRDAANFYQMKQKTVNRNIIF